MVDHNHQKIFIGTMSIIMLIVGLLLGFYLARNFQLIDFQIIYIGLLFVIVILLLFVGSLVIDLKNTLNFQLMQKSRRKK